MTRQLLKIVKDDTLDPFLDTDCQLNFQEINEVIKEFDLDKDGKLNMDEFRKSSQSGKWKHNVGFGVNFTHLFIQFCNGSVFMISSLE